MPVIAAVNLKGGVGKTSTCLHLAGACLSSAGISYWWTTTRRVA